LNTSPREIQRFLYQQARQQPSQPLSRLARYMTDWTVLEAAWGQVRRSQGADTPGADLVAARELRGDPRAAREWLQDLADRIQAGTYRPGPVRRFEIPKPGRPGKTRSLAILTMTDRVVHMALKLVLEPIVEARLGERAFGFRPGRSRFDELNAVRRAARDHPGTFGAALTADIASCFDQLDHRLLLGDVRSVVADPGVLSLMGLVLEQVGAGRAGWWGSRRVGVLQGSPLSPLLANWNLARFDRTWARRAGDPAPLFRYADDLVVLAPDAPAARRLRPALERCLWRSNRLRLAPEKTAAFSFEEGVPLLGLMVRRLRDPFEEAEKVRILLDPARIREVLDEVRGWAEGLDPDRPLGPQFARFNQRLRGWFESYQFGYDAPQAFEAIDGLVFGAVRARLKALLGCSASTLQHRHYLRTKTGHQTWHADGEALLVLSSLPRRCYRPKTSRSPWEPAAPRETPEPYPSIPLPGLPALGMVGGDLAAAAGRDGAGAPVIDQGREVPPAPGPRGGSPTDADKGPARATGAPLLNGAPRPPEGGDPR
jgi:RNA-directed DNA polymerase